MTINDPIVIWALGLLVLAVGGYCGHLHRSIASNRREIATNRDAIADLRTQMAAHDGNKEMLDRMYIKLDALSDLTQRIAGHLKIK